MRGRLLQPQDEGYAASTAGHNTVLTHRPALVVAAACAEDVREAVLFAGRHGLTVAVQATGHGQAVSCDGALLISTAAMDGVSVDPAARTARIEAGARWEAVIAAAAEHGLAPPSGSSPRVGAIGYTLGGGIGPLGRAHGYAADNVRSFEAVTADGTARHVSADRDPDLFWALRGGKGNFGVVTSMVIDLFPVERVYGGGLFFPGEYAEPLLRSYRTWAKALPEEMSAAFALVRFPDAPAVPAEVRGHFAIHLRVAYLGAPERGAELLAPMREAGPLLLDTVAEMPFTEVGSINNDPTEPGPYYERSTVIGDLGPEPAGVLMELAGPHARCPLLVVELRPLDGALARRPRPGNAVGNRGGGFAVFTASVPVPDASTVAEYQDRLVGALAPYGTGGPFLSFQSAEEASQEQVRAAYEAADYRELSRLKRAYDPGNVFRHTHNIPPAL
ncbi:hypothetical protein LP52_09200 [Streptomonospora alba]|uniref:FAD-binding PCMH-type domain-containing protein n=1 Tax=Streptomonospora alba TaxID=183763 RepID=A0A0C2JCJ0_9ACTN|nr:hypothetical protein LP52_09200 [Streptomonospora alba]